MKGLQIRWLVALVLLSLPYVLLFLAGSVWLYEYGMLIAWCAVSFAATLLGWWLVKGSRRAAPPPLVEPDPNWPPLGMEAWQGVEALAEGIAAENLPLDQPEKCWEIVRRVVEAVARHYHPGSADPWLETPFPHVMRVVELAARDLRRATMGYVPGAHILTMRDWRRLWQLAGRATRWYNHLYLWYRIISPLVNTPAALFREGRDLMFGKLRDESAGALKHWAVGFFVRRVGYYAIQLYGGQLLLDDAEPADAPGRQSQKDAATAGKRDAALDAEPLRILVVGQTKAGKSSLINALFGEYRAATDVVPRTQNVEPYVLNRDGLPQAAIVLDTAGYDQAGPEQLLDELRKPLLGCDLILCACSATTAARNADRSFLDAVRDRFQRDVERHVPVILAVVTKIDQLRPISEWQPPYCLCPPEGPKAEQIAAAVQAVAEDLGVTVDDVVPVCLAPGRCYNVDEALVPAIAERLPAARRVQYLRCLRQLRNEEFWRLLWRQTVQAGRVLVTRLHGTRRGPPDSDPRAGARPN
jgi:predicted GTPase